MATLTGQSIASSYEQLLHVDNDGGGNGTTHVAVKDGDNGTTFPITLATDAIMITSTNRLEFGDDGTYIHQSADGVLDLVSDTTLELNGGAGSMKIDTNSRISLSNNDSGNTGGSDGTSGNTIYGYLAGQDIASGGVDNTYFGHNAGSENATGDDNVYLGANAGKGVNGNSNSSNVGIGSGSMLKITTGSENVGIGKTVMDDATSGSGNVAIGTECLMNLTTGINNVAIGKASLNGSGVNPSSSVAVGNQAGRYAEGNNNVALGQSALKGDNAGNFVGHSNIAIGYEAMDALEVGEEYNIAIGSGAIGAMQEGSAGGDVDHNIAIGRDAFKGGDLDSADNQVLGNIAIGSYALDATGANAQTGTIAIGQSNLSELTSGQFNLSIGYETMGVHTTGGKNVAIGHQVMFDTNAGSNSLGSSENVFIGFQVASGTWTDAACNHNVGIGNDVMRGALDGAINNVGLGSESLIAITQGDDNTCLGFQSGDVITTGSNNCIIGSGADPSANSATNQIVIGQGATGVGNNWATIGNANIANVAMNQNGNAIVHAAGIFFPATQVANSDANVLDDYEEGLDTVAIACDSGSITIHSSNDQIAYTKIGRVVHITGRLNVSAISSPSGNLTITGLPFTAADTTETSELGAGAVYLDNASSAIDTSVICFVATGTTTLHIRESGGTGNGADLANHVDTDTKINIEVTYFTT